MKKANPNQPHADDGKREVNGSVRISGKVETNLPPGLMEQYTSAQKDSNEREDRAELREIANEGRDILRFRIDVVTLIVVTVYASLTAIQSCEAIHSADAAKSAADTAKKTLIISERAYISVPTPIAGNKSAIIQLPISNIGHIPAAPATITVYEATVNFDISRDVPFLQPPTEYHPAIYTIESIPYGSAYQINVAVPKIDHKEIAQGRQFIYVAGYIKYGDGFSEDGQQTQTFCWNSTHGESKAVTWAPCSSITIDRLSAANWNPNEDH